MDLKPFMTEQEIQDYSLLKSEEACRIFCAEILKRSFKAFVYLVGYRDLGAFHESEIEALSQFKHLNGRHRKLWLWARGHFKTSLISEAHTLWLIVNNPDIRLLTVSNTLEIAKTVLKNIKERLISNSEFRFFFREFCPIPNKEGKIEFGTSENFTIPNRTKNLKEPTVMCAGIGTNLTGLHFDVMKIDDLVTKDSVSNDTQILASKDYYASLRQLFDNPTIPREDIVGTPYHFNDLYGDIKKSNDFEKSFIPCKDDNGNPIFGERFSIEGLDEILHDPTVGPYNFASQYMLNPIDPLNAKFKGEWIKHYEKIAEGLSQYICVDPASTQKKKSDYTVIELWGVDWEGKHYLLDGVRDKLTVFQRIDRVVEFAKKAGKNLASIKYEVLGGRHGDLESLRKRLIEEKIPIIPQETKSTNASKKDRIEQRLVGQFFAGNIFMPNSLTYRSTYDGKVKDFVQEYKLEYLQFPFTEHDDILDCHSQMFEEQMSIIKGKKPKEEIRKNWGTADDWDALYRRIDREQRLNPFFTREQAVNRIKARNWNRLIKGKI